MAISLLYRDREPNKGFELYRHYDANGLLLYVGMSSDTIRRLGQHASSSSWYPDIAKVVVEGCLDANDARRRETDAIRSERPIHNNLGQRLRPDEELTRPRKQRILEKAGLRYVAAWLPVDLADSLAPEIEKAEIIAADALANVGEKP